MKKDVWLLVAMVAVLSIFNVLVMQFFVQEGGQSIGENFESRALPSAEKQTQESEGASDSKVFQYVNNKLKKYGYDPLGSEDDSDNVEIGEETENQSENEEQTADNSDENTEEPEENSEVPPNDDGPPAESVEGKDLVFNVDFGLG